MRSYGGFDIWILKFEIAAVENDAIVAANTDKRPRDVSPYRYVWIRDAAFICVAADVQGIKIQKNLG